MVYKGIGCRPSYSGGCQHGKESGMRQIEVDEVIPLVEERLVQAPLWTGRS